MSELKQIGRWYVQDDDTVVAYPHQEWTTQKYDRELGRKSFRAREDTKLEVSERSDGKWEVMDKTLKTKTYPDKETLLVALALQGVRVDE